MSFKSERKSVKSSSKLKEQLNKKFARISIKISEVKNLENLSSDAETTFEVVAKFMNSRIKLNKDENLVRFKSSDDEIQLLYVLQVDIDDEGEIFNLFANSVQLTLIEASEKNSLIIGHANVDLYPLCSDLAQSFQTELCFEEEKSSGEEVQDFPKVHFNVEISSDQPILKTPRVNCLYITLHSICNFETENSTIEFGLKAPVGSQFLKNVVFSTETSSQTEMSNYKRWFSLSNVLGKGAESQFKDEPYDYPISSDENDLIAAMQTQIALNAIGRIFLTHESNDLFHKHINKSMKIAIEVMSGENHLVGFIDVEDLIQVGRKKLRCVVPLKTFNTQTLKNNCNYSSVFYKPRSTLKPRKSKKELDRKSTILETISESPDEFEEVQVLNKDGELVFVIVELELEKPLNEELFEDSTEMLIQNGETVELGCKNEVSQTKKLENFKKNLQTVVKNICSIYGKDVTVPDLMKKMMNDGYYACIEDHLLPEICALGSEKYSAADDFDEVRQDFMCQLTSFALNNSKKNVDKSQSILLAHIYDFLGLKLKSEEIYLKHILDNDSEENWISYGVYSLRKEKFNRTVVCIEEAKKKSSSSLIGDILKCYIEFKLQNFPECLRLLAAIKLEFGDFLELSMIRHIITSEEIDISHTQFKQQPRIEEIYKTREVLWFATTGTKNLVNWRDSSIRSAIFFIKLGCFDFAEIVLEDYFEKRGFNVNNLYLHAVIQAMKGNYQQSLLHLNQICRDDIGNHQVNYEEIVSLQSLMLLKLQSYENVEKFTKSFETPQIEHFLVNFMLGKFYNDSGEPQKALPLLIQAQHILPSQLTLTNLGKCYQSLNKLPSAELCFIRAINYDVKDSSAAWNHLYNIYMKQKRSELVYLCIENSNCF